MECIIKVNNTFIHYKGVKEVRIDYSHVSIYLHNEYCVKGAHIRDYNVSVEPFVHQFYDATIIAVRE